MQCLECDRSWDCNHQLSGGLNNLYFYPYPGKLSNLTNIFFKWVVQPPTSQDSTRTLTISPLWIKQKVDLQGNDQPISSQKGFWPWLKYCKDFGTCQHPAKSVGKRQWNGRVAAFGPDDCLLIPTPRMRPVKNHQLHDPTHKTRRFGCGFGCCKGGARCHGWIVGCCFGCCFACYQGCVYWQWAWTLSCSFGAL